MELFVWTLFGVCLGTVVSPGIIFHKIAAKFSKHPLSCPYCHKPTSVDDLEKHAEEWRKAYVMLIKKPGMSSDRVEVALQILTPEQKDYAFGKADPSNREVTGHA